MTEKEVSKLHLELLTKSGNSSATSQFVYMALLMEARDNPTCSPSIQRLMRFTKMSRRSIQIHMRSLEDLGLVISSPRTDYTGRSEPNEVFLPKLKEAIDEFVAKKNRKSSPGTRKGPVAS